MLRQRLICLFACFYADMPRRLCLRRIERCRLLSASAARGMAKCAAARCAYAARARRARSKMLRGVMRRVVNEWAAKDVVRW